MARFTATSTDNSVQLSAGVPTTEREYTLLLEPSEGYHIKASNFKIGNGIEEVPGSAIWTRLGSAGSGFEYNADAGIEKVRFVDLGDVDSVDNTVNAIITLNAFTPTVTKTLFVDIDENDENPIEEIDETVYRSLEFSVFVKRSTATWDESNIATYSSAINGISSGSPTVTVDPTTGLTHRKYGTMTLINQVPASSPGLLHATHFVRSAITGFESPISEGFPAGSTSDSYYSVKLFGGSPGLEYNDPNQDLSFPMVKQGVGPVWVGTIQLDINATWNSGTGTQGQWGDIFAANGVDFEPPYALDEIDGIDPFNKEAKVGGVINLNEEMSPGGTNNGSGIFITVAQSADASLFQGAFSWESVRAQFTGETYGYELLGPYTVAPFGPSNPLEHYNNLRREFRIYYNPPGDYTLDLEYATSDFVTGSTYTRNFGLSWIQPFNVGVNPNWPSGPVGMPPPFQITKCEYPPTVPHTGGSKTLKVFGNPGTPYSISVQKKASTTSDITAGSNGYYNFKTRTFQTAETSAITIVKPSGFTSHEVLFPTSTSQVRYDVTLSGLVDGVHSTLDASVPTAAGQAKIRQFGTKTLTIKPITYVPGNFGSMPANIEITKRVRFRGDGYTAAPIKEVKTTGGNGGVSSTRIKLDNVKDSLNIHAGMYAIGYGVAHLATVISSNKDEIILSLASAVADGTDLTFISDNGSVSPFKFIVVQNAGEDALSVTGPGASKGVEDILRTRVGGLDRVSATINGGTTSATHTLDTTKGIVPGMVVTGEEVSVHAGRILKVESITNGTVIVLNQIQTFTDNAVLEFNNKNTTSPTKVHSVQVNEVGSPAAIHITGYVQSDSIAQDAEVRILLDDIITTA